MVIWGERSSRSTFLNVNVHRKHLGVLLNAFQQLWGGALSVCTFTDSLLALGGFPGGSAGKESACSAGDLGSIPGLGRSSGGNVYPLQYSGLENSMDCIVRGATESDTTEQLSHIASTLLPVHRSALSSKDLRKSV